MNKYLIHPKMMDKLEDTFFPLLCTITTPPDPNNAANKDAVGEVTAAFTTKFTNIPARKAEFGRYKDEKRQPIGTFDFHGYIITLKGNHNIAPKDRAVIDGMTYDILSVHNDSELQMTRLIAEIVT
jgi:hypothetical protein